jgi:hypothetical protein
VWRVLVTTATDHGATTVLPVRNGSTERVLIVARSDGITGPRIPRGARQKLASLGSIVPVMLLPYHHPWRYDATTPLSSRSRYHRALVEMIKRLDTYDRAITRSQPSTIDPAERPRWSALRHSPTS